MGHPLKCRELKVLKGLTWNLPNGTLGRGGGVRKTHKNQNKIKKKKKKYDKKLNKNVQELMIELMQMKGLLGQRISKCYHLSLRRCFWIFLEIILTPKLKLIFRPEWAQWMRGLTSRFFQLGLKFNLNKKHFPFFYFWAFVVTSTQNHRINILFNIIKIFK